MRYTYSVYVIRLRIAVRNVRRFADANPKHRLDQPCVYVGSTAHPPKFRYARHIAEDSKVGSKFVQRYHKGMHKPLTAEQPVFDTREEAEIHEKLLTKRLRKKGFGVWSG